MCVIFNMDIVIGILFLIVDYIIVGLRDVWYVLNEVFEWFELWCYVWKLDICIDEVWEKVVIGKVIVKDWFVVGFVDDEGELVGIIDDELLEEF